MKKDSRENIYSLKGFGHVFRFTFLQTIKNKGFIATAIMMILMMALMKPLMYLFTNAGMSQAKSKFTVDVTDIESKTMTILNDTDFVLTSEDIVSDNTKEAKEGKLTSSGITIKNKGEATEQELLSSLGKEDILIIIRQDQAGYKVNGIISDESQVTVSSLNDAVDCAMDIFKEARQKQMKMDDQVVDSLSAGVSTGGIITEEEYTAEQEQTLSRNEYTGIIMGFAIIIILVTSLSASYVIVSVNEEKQSKLAETLLVSVRPMALLMGKIIAMLAFVVGTVILGMVGAMIADLIMESATNMDAAQISSNAGINLAIFTSYGPVAGIFLVLELILTLSSFGVLSGILGSSCSQTEDQQSATSVTMMLVMVGYFASFILGGFNATPTTTLACSLIPPVSYFMAPVAYIGGRISIYVLLGSFAIQIVVLVLLVMLAAKTYRSLLLSDTSKPKLKTIFAMARN